MFPDAAPLHLSRIQIAIERAGLQTRHVEDFPDGLRARRCSHWQRRFEANIERGASGSSATSACASGGSTCASSRSGFESGFMSVYQVRCVEAPLAHC